MASTASDLFDGLAEGFAEPAPLTRARAAKKPRAKSKSELTKELAQWLVAALRSRNNGHGEGALITLRELASMSGNPTAMELTAAVATKLFKADAVLPKPPSKTFPVQKALDLPVALVKDIDRLAGDARVLFAALREKRKDQAKKIHAFSVAELKGWLSGKLLKDSFSMAVNRQMDVGALPNGIGWLHINARKLFLVDDLHLPSKRVSQGAATSVESAPSPASSASGSLPRSSASTADFAARFDEVFAHMDRHNGSYNFVWLTDLRDGLPEFSRSQFDAGLKELRRARQYQLNAGESRFGLTPQQQAAAILEDGTLHTSVSRVQQ